MATVNLSMRVGQQNLTRSGQDMLARSMFDRGKEFIVAAILLRREERAYGRDDEDGYSFVALHCLCQGVEIILKSVLLFSDYGTYQPLLKNRKRFGHNLVALEAEVRSLLGYKENPRLVAELQTLNRFFSKHLLRYSNMGDFFFDPRKVEIRAVYRRVARLMFWMSARLEKNEALKFPSKST